MGNNITLFPLAPITAGSKWVVDDTRLRTLKPGVDVELIQTFLSKV